MSVSSVQSLFFPRWCTLACIKKPEDIASHTNFIFSSHNIIYKHSKHQSTSQRDNRLLFSVRGGKAESADYVVGSVTYNTTSSHANDKIISQLDIDIIDLKEPNFFKWWLSTLKDNVIAHLTLSLVLFLYIVQQLFTLLHVTVQRLTQGILLLNPCN